MGLIKTHAFWPQLLMAAPFPSENQRLHIAQDTVAMFLSHYQVSLKVQE
ncbi:MAG TPA: hypothetical protein DE045_10155 [Oceanospirillaceae bacterium]|nr:hypothetical protein [Oceanospirillaceae bacterium]